MADNFDKSAILGSFLDEVDAYIPEIEAHLDMLQQTPDDETAIEEAYRRTHTIYGSAAMMEFAGLAAIAQTMELILDDALERRAALDQPTIALLRRSCGRLARVAHSIRAGGSDAAVVAEDKQDHEAYRGAASGGLNGRAPSSASAPSSWESASSAPASMPNGAQSNGAQGQASDLPDWLAVFGAGNGAQGSAQPSQNAPQNDAWASSLTNLPTGVAPIVSPQSQSQARTDGFGLSTDPWAQQPATDARPAAQPATQPPSAGRSAPVDTTAAAGAIDDLLNDEADVRRQVSTLRETVASLYDAAKAMDNERLELQSFLDGSSDALERLEEWVGRQMGLDLQRSPDNVRNYLPLSVIWVTTTRLKKLVAMLNSSGRNLTLSQEQIDETLGQFRTSLTALSQMAGAFGSAGAGGFSATVAQVTWSPSSASASMPAVDALAPGQRAEIERSVREELRRSLEDEVRQEIAADVRGEEEQRIRQELEVQIRRQMMFSALGPGMGDSSVSVTDASVEVRPQARPARQVQITDEQSAEALEVFREEAQEHLQTITAGIAALERAPGDPNGIQSVRRAMHTLKGAAGMMGFVVVQSLAHASEDLLEQLAEQGRALTVNELSLVFDTAETLDQLISGVFADARQERTTAQALIDRYAAITGVPVANLLAHDSGDDTAETVAIDLGVDAEESTKKTADDLSVRVRLSKLDELVTLYGDLLINRSVFDERVTRVYQLVGDSTQATERLREMGVQLEKQFEMFMLPTGQSGTQPQQPQQSAGFRFPWSSPQRNGAMQGAPEHVNEFHELELDRYSEFHRLSRIQSEAVTDVLALNTELETVVREIQVSSAREARLSSEIQDRLLKLRLVPVSSLTSRLYRAARASASKTGKEVEFFVEGGETEVDRKVIEEVEGPLLHLVRNAVNHGIERPDARYATGKPRTGRITVSAAYEGNQVVIDVRDDGAGIDPQRIRQTALAKGWIDAYSNLSDREALNLIFQPGVSTAETLTEEAGRGVGLDVVRDAAIRLKGSVDVDSSIGTGSVFTLKFPISLQIARAVLVKAGPRTYAIPMAVVDQIGRLDYYERTATPAPAVLVRNERYALARLSTYLNTPAAPLAERSSLLIVHAGRRKVALVVDGIVNQQEVVAKPLGSHLRDVRGVAGATTLGNGQVVIILDLLELLANPTEEHITLPVPGQRAAAPQPAPARPAAPPAAPQVAARAPQPSTPQPSTPQPPTPSPFAPQPSKPMAAPQFPFGAPAQAAPAASQPAPSGGWPLPGTPAASPLDSFLTAGLPNAQNAPGSVERPPWARGGEPVSPPPWEAPVSQMAAQPAAPVAPPDRPTVSPQGTASTLGQRDFVVTQRSAFNSGRLDAPSVAKSYLLVVDDSPSVRRVVSGMLKARGWETQAARDGVEALDVIARERPSAVLLDIEMPRMDGYELMATLRSDPQYRNLPLIVLTSRAAAKHQQRATQLGANAYIVKPYQDDFLLSTISDLVRRSAAGTL